MVDLRSDRSSNTSNRSEGSLPVSGVSPKSSMTSISARERLCSTLRYLPSPLAMARSAKSSYDVADTVERCNASEGGCQE